MEMKTKSEEKEFEIPSTSELTRGEEDEEESLERGKFEKSVWKGKSPHMRGMMHRRAASTRSSPLLRSGFSFQFIVRRIRSFEFLFHHIAVLSEIQFSGLFFPFRC
jgi:hypothetical protein